MFGSLGLPEILFILVLALLVFGPRRLPEVGRTIGRALGEFRRATGDLKRTFDQETSALERDAGLPSTPASTRSSTPEPLATTAGAESSLAEAEAEAEAYAGVDAGVDAEADAELPNERNGDEGGKPS